jgi:hypothetical protein
MAQILWHMLLWGRTLEGVVHIKEGDIVDVVQAQPWGRMANETRLCLIVPAYGLTMYQAGILKDKGIVLKRKYKIDFESLDSIKFLDKSAIRDEKRSYQPFLDEGIMVNMNKMKIVKDKNNEIVNMENIHLRI